MCFSQTKIAQGIELYKQGEYKNAVDLLREISNETIAAHYLSLSYEGLGKTPDAIESHKKTIDICLDLIREKIEEWPLYKTSSSDKLSIKKFVQEKAGNEIAAAYRSSQRLKEIDREMAASKDWEIKIEIIETHFKGDNLVPIKENSDEKPLLPEIKNRPEPNFPNWALGKNISKKVELYVQFLSSGKIGMIASKSVYSLGFTENCFKAAKKIKFTPAMQGGKPVSIYKVVQYVFNP
jgi:tetratricopeptide (TPR) repeat protein